MTVFALRLGDEGERKREAEADRQHLLGIERDVENLPGHIQHPEHDAGDQQSLQHIGQKDGRLRGGGGELLRAGEEPFLGSGGGWRRRLLSCHAVRSPRRLHWNAFAAMFLSLKYFKAPGWIGNL